MKGEERRREDGRKRKNRKETIGVGEEEEKNINTNRKMWRGRVRRWNFK